MMCPAFLALFLIALAGSASAALVPYEAVDGTRGTARGNNLVDVTATGACGFAIVAGNVVLTGCRDRVGATCPSGGPCDLDRVPAGRCTLGSNGACIWPSGAGYCIADPNVGCLATSDCASHALAGTCDTSVCPGGDCSGCACQGTDDSLATFETNAARCGGTLGVCSDGDGELAYAPSLSGGLCFNLVLPSDRPIGCGREAGQAFSGARSPFENPPLTPTPQREPGSGSQAGPIAALRTTMVYDMGAVEPGRGGVRRLSLLGDSFFADASWADKNLSGAFGHLNVLPLACETPPGWSTDDALPGGQSCWGTAASSTGYVWTQNVPSNDFLPAGSATTDLDVDSDGAADCPPHCGLSYDVHTLEQLALEAVARLDARAGAQLAFAATADGPAGAGDLLAFTTLVPHVWFTASDQRCWVGGDPEVVCSTCVAGACSGRPDLACASDRDCALYVGRCSGSEQPCDPASPNGATPNHTACPGPELCRSCLGAFAEGQCVVGGGTCRVDSDCGGGECGDSAGNPVYPEPGASNPLAIPVGYNTHGFAELELETKCGPTRPGRIGIVAGVARTLAPPVALVFTTGAAAAEVRDPDTAFSVPPDTAWLGSAPGGLLGIAAPGGAPLDGGSYSVGRQFPVDAAGAPCCTATGNVTTTLDKSSDSVRAVVTENAAAITWPAGSGGTPAGTLVRTSGWGAGADRTPGCPGDSSSVDALGALPDVGPCNDPLGVGASVWCTGGDCEGNSGADDARTTETIGGVAGVPAIAARAKVPNPYASGASAPNLIAVASFSGIDLDLGGSSNTDFSAGLEVMHCPLVGDCSQAGAQDCIADSDCGTGNTCQNRARRCATGEPPPGCDADGIPDASDNCPCVSNPGQENGDGDTHGNACDNCPTTTNQDQANFDADAWGDVCDTCETVADLGSDTDSDGVDAACDTCTSIANIQYATAPATNRSFISHQRDDDVDGRGNRCDFNYDNSGVTVAATDFNAMKANVGQLVTASTCTLGPRCGEFDHDGSGATVAAADFNLTKAAVGKVESSAFPKCAACAVGTGWSNAIGTGGERLGRPTCQSAVGGACIYAP